MSISVTVSYAPEQFVVMGSMYGYGKRGFLNRYQVKVMYRTGTVIGTVTNVHYFQFAAKPTKSQVRKAVKKAKRNEYWR